MCSIVSCMTANQTAAPNDESIFGKIFKKLIKGNEKARDFMDKNLSLYLNILLISMKSTPCIITASPSCTEWTSSGD